MLSYKKKCLFFLLCFVWIAVGCAGRAPLPREDGAQVPDMVQVSDTAQAPDTAPLSDDLDAGAQQRSGQEPLSPAGFPEVSKGEGQVPDPEEDDPAAGADRSAVGTDSPGRAASGAGRTKGADSDLTVWLGSDLYSMDPVQGIHELEKTLILHQYEPLLIQDQDGRLLPGQAQSYEVSADGLTYTFHLWEDLRWSDGSPLTASDFVYAWKRLADHRTASPYAEDLLGIVAGFPEAAEKGGRGLGVSAKDDQTFVVTLAEPRLNFIRSCAHPALSPVKASSVEALAKVGDADWSLSVDTLAGNGPLELDRWVEGEYIRFVKNPHYRDQAKVSLRSLTVLLAGDHDQEALQEQLREQLLAGQLQLMLCDPFDTEPYLEELAGGKGSKSKSPEGQGRIPLKKGQAPKAGTYYLLFNQRLEPFQDPKVRAALSMVLDREAIADTAMEGNALPAYSLIGPGISDADGPTGSSFCQNAQDDYAFPHFLSRTQTPKYTDPSAAVSKDRTSLNGSGAVGPAERSGGADQTDQTTQTERPDPAGETWETARALLSQAGYPNGSGLPAIQLLTNDSGCHIAIAQAMQSTWARLGVQLTIRKITWQYFTPSRHSGDFMIARASWLMDTDDPLPFLEQFTTDHPLNDSHYTNPQVDAAIQAAKTVKDRQTYYQALHKAEQIILEEAAAIPIAHYQDTWYQAEDLDGAVHMPDGTWRFPSASLSP